jgi:hypothetical protein
MGTEKSKHCADCSVRVIAILAAPDPLSAVKIVPQIKVTHLDFKYGCGNGYGNGCDNGCSNGCSEGCGNSFGYGVSNG